MDMTLCHIGGWIGQLVQIACFQTTIAALLDLHEASLLEFLKGPHDRARMATGALCKPLMGGVASAKLVRAIRQGDQCRLLTSRDSLKLHCPQQILQISFQWISPTANDIQLPGSFPPGSA